MFGGEGTAGCDFGQVAQFAEIARGERAPKFGGRAVEVGLAGKLVDAARQWTASIARQWAVIILLCSYGIEAVGTKTSLPFGDYTYTDNFGPLIWVVPITIPFAWHVVVTNALFLVRAIAPHVAEWMEAAMVGVICTIYDIILEPFATTVKHYWNWAGGTIPQLNYIAWFVLSAGLVYLFAPTLSSAYRRDPRPFLVLALTVAIFVAGKLAG